MIRFLSISVLCSGLLLFTGDLNPVLPRTYFGARFEPENYVLHGAGQSPKAFKDYTKAMKRRNRPVLYMTYCSARTHLYAYFTNLVHNLEKYPMVLIPQIGFSMTYDGQPEKHFEHEVAAGWYDTRIDSFAKAIRMWPHPVYLRIGYEFNGHWNGYEPATYIEAYKKVVDLFRKNKVDNVAFVWCVSPDGRNKDYMQFYPGDDYVDWWSIDLFSVKHFTDTLTIRFLQDAGIHRKPVMIGESTPRKVGVKKEDNGWERWFVPYFNLIRSHPQIKAFCYINWDWSVFEYWKDWGDARIETNPYILRNYRKEMQHPLYFHSSDWNNVHQVLHFVAPETYH